MPRPVRLVLLASLILLLIVVVAVAGLLAVSFSEKGTSILASQAQRWTGDLLTWQELEGKLGGPLVLRGVTLTQPGLALELGTLTLDWDPWALAGGALRVNVLRAEDMRIALATTEAPPAAEPFNPASLQLPIDIFLQGVQLKNLQLIQGDQPARVINRVDLGAQLEDGLLTLQRLDVVLAEGSLGLSGRAALDSNMPLDLKATWQLQPGAFGLAPRAGAPAAGAMTGALSLGGDIDWREGIAAGLDYQLSAAGLDGLNADIPPHITVAGQLRANQLGERVSLELFSLALADTSLELSLVGQLRQASAAEPVIEVKLQWSELQWPLTGENPRLASAAGSLQLSGSPSAYAVELSTELGGREIPAGQWQGQGSGDASQLTLHRLHGVVLGGQLQATGLLEWDPILRWDLELQGSELDPGQLVPDVPGQLAVNLTTAGQLGPDRGVLAEVELERLGGTLLDYDLNLGARFRLEGEILQILALQLESGGNQLNADGSVSADTLALDWHLDVAHPGAFIAGAAGSLAGSGSIQGGTRAPRVRASLVGKALRLQALAIESIQADLEAGLEPGDKLSLQLVAGPVDNHEQALLESFQLQAGGTTARHDLAVKLETTTETLQARLEGGLTPDRDVWNGHLTELDAQSDQFGNWQLDQPGTLKLAASEVALGNSCLLFAAGSARLCTRLDWAQSGGSKLNTTLQALPLQMFAPDINGELAGEMEASLAADGKLRANGAFRLSPGQVNLALDGSVKQLEYGGGDLAVTITGDGLAANLEFAAPEQGKVAAELQLPAFTSLPLPQRQPLAGRIQAILPDLSGFAAWIPQLAATAGRLEADLRPAGTLEEPAVIGELILSGGAADIPVAGLQLRNIELRAKSSPEQAGQMNLSGSLASGSGQAELSGQVNIPARSLALEISGEKLQVYNTPDARVQLSPDLAIGWSEDTLKLRGQLTVPRADITPRLGLSPATMAEDPAAAPAPGQLIAPSADVVVVNAPQDRPTAEPQPLAPFRIDSELQLVLGDKVKVDALGFISRITGAVTFSNRPDSTELLPLAKGRLSLQDGTFRAFGQDLNIETGQIIFANVPANEPELNVRAVRWIDNDPEVTAAGIMVTGPVTEPVLELFSRPQLDASEIQSYLLTGRSARDKDNVLSVGTYILPSLFVGYGYNLLEGTGQFNSLFSITPRYGVGTNVGEADNNINLTISYER